MLGTLLALVIALFLQIHPIPQQIDLSALAAIMLLISIPFLIIFPLGLMWTWLPMQKAEQNATPRILEMFRLDNHIRMTGGVIVAFPLITLAMVGGLLYIYPLERNLILGLWILLLGITIDSLRHYAKRVMRYLNPFSVVTLFTEYAKATIRNNQESDLCHWVDALTEVGIKGIQRHSSAICNLIIDELQEISQLFLEASKSIAHPNKDAQSEALGISDKVGFMMFFIYQRLDMIFQKALNNRMETTCNHLIAVLGKIAVSAAKYDVSLASVPLRFLGKCASHAQNEGLEETPITASCTLLEVAKIILTDIDIRYYEIKDAFLSIINGMDILAKGTFKRNKETNIVLLMQPFKDLKKLFEQPNTKDHQDTPIILQSINRVLGEFEALLLVMNTMPKIPDIEEKKAEKPA